MDIKLLANILAHKHNVNLADLIASDLVGFIPGREMRDKVRQMFSLLHIVKQGAACHALLSVFE